MAEYVNKATAVSIVSAMGRNTDCDCVKKRLEKAAKRISLLSSADVAPVVRCRDCKFMLPDVLPYVGKAYAVGLKCDLRDDYSICEGDYCSRGVRRGGDPDGR